jgi:hypothetical protein
MACRQSDPTRLHRDRAVHFSCPYSWPVAVTFWRFLQIRPQVLSVWILKSRLASTERQILVRERLRQDMHYFIFSCVSFLLCMMTCFFEILFAMLFQLPGVNDAALGNRTVTQLWPIKVSLGILLFSYVPFVVGIFIIKSIILVVYCFDEIQDISHRKADRFRIAIQARSSDPVVDE